MATTNLYEKVYRYILDKIFRQELSYGQKISEEEISENLGVSRTPIREAFRRLETEGVIEIFPKRFVQVVTLTDEDVKQLGFVRLYNDVLAAQLAVFNGSNSDFQCLDRINKECEEAADNNDVYTLMKKDSEFHEMITEIGGNQMLSKFQSEIQLKVSLNMSIKQKSNSEFKLNLESHRMIIEALYSRDVNKVISAVTNHIIDFYNIEYSNYVVPITLFEPERYSIDNGRII